MIGVQAASAQESGALDQASGSLPAAAGGAVRLEAGTDRVRPLDARARALVEPVPCSASGTGRVSASGRISADLVELGRSRSATFDRLVSAIEQSDVMVVVMTGRMSRAAQLVFATATPYGRIVRVTLSVPEIADRLIPSLAHELQHALEIASDCTVVSPMTMERFYRDHGHAVGDGIFCTLAAQEVTRTVAQEIGTTTRARR